MRVFVAHSLRDQRLAATVGGLLREDGHQVFVAADMVTSADALAEISAAIRSADVVVAVLGADSPSVFFELGLALGAGVPTLVAAPPGELLPADLASVPYIQLTGDALRDAQAVARRMGGLRSEPPDRPATFRSAEAALRAASRDPALLESLSPADFGELLMRLFSERGYSVAAGRAVEDMAGVDFYLELPGDRKRVLVQVKKLNRQSRVSVETVRRLLSAVLAAGPFAPVAMLVAASGYTTAARALAAEAPVLLRTLEEVLAAKSAGDLLAKTRAD